MRKSLRLVAAALVGSCLLAGGACAGISALGAHGLADGALEIVGAHPADGATGALKLMSLNLAHGRRDAFHQLLVSDTDIEKNLADIGAVVARNAPDVVAVQEADAESFWSGRFDHVRRIAERAELPVTVHGAHVRGAGLRYGTGLISRISLTDARALTFGAGAPMPPKGVTVATALLDGAPVDVVSVHLDPASSDSRAAQVREMTALLKKRGHPVVLLGDFNCGWADEGSAVRAAADALDLVAYQPEADPADPQFCTFPGFGARLDWILVSKDLELVEHRVLTDTLSDHRALVATVTRTAIKRPS